MSSIRFIYSILISAEFNRSVRILHRSELDLAVWECCCLIHRVGGGGVLGFGWWRGLGCVAPTLGTPCARACRCLCHSPAPTGVPGPRHSQFSCRSHSPARSFAFSLLLPRAILSPADVGSSRHSGTTLRLNLLLGGSARRCVSVCCGSVVVASLSAMWLRR